MSKSWRSSFFYLFFPTVGGTFPALLLIAYYLYPLGLWKKYQRHYFFSFFLAVLLQLHFYFQSSQTLLAPFPFRQLLNSPQAVMHSSLSGLFLALVFLLFLRKKTNTKLHTYIEQEWPIIPSLLACALGGLFNLLIVFLLWFFLMNF